MGLDVLTLGLLGACFFNGVGAGIGLAFTLWHWVSLTDRQRLNHILTIAANFGLCALWLYFLGNPPN